MLGVVLPDEDPASKDFEVWPENWPALQMFLRVQTQWRVEMNGLIGLDYGAVAWLLSLYSETDQHRELLEALQIMEGAVLAATASKEA